MKTKFITLVVATSAVCLLCACSEADNAQQSNAADTVIDIATTQYFTDEAVSEANI